MKSTIFCPHVAQIVVYSGAKLYLSFSWIVNKTGLWQDKYSKAHFQNCLVKNLMGFIVISLADICLTRVDRRRYFNLKNGQVIPIMPIFELSQKHWEMPCHLGQSTFKRGCKNLVCNAKVLFLEDISPISFQINKKKRWETKVVSIKEVWLSPQKLLCPRLWMKQKIIF